MVVLRMTNQTIKDVHKHLSYLHGNIGWYMYWCTIQTNLSVSGDLMMTHVEEVSSDRHPGSVLFQSSFLLVGSGCKIPVKFLP